MTVGIGEAEMRFCSVHDEDGLWRVFWMERGNRNELSEFTDEQDACLEYMRRVAGPVKVTHGSPLSAGPTWPPRRSKAVTRRREHRQPLVQLLDGPTRRNPAE